MDKVARLAATLALTLVSAVASAGLHQICYEGPAVLANYDGDKVLEWVSTGIYGCSQDGPGFCTITPLTSNFRIRQSASPLDQGVQANGTFRFFDFAMTNTTEPARIEFFDLNGIKIAERICTVNPRLTYGGDTWSPSAGAVLTGFSTDASGLVTTGVWRGQSATAGANGPTNTVGFTVRAPGDFVSVGGGSMGVETPLGAHVAGSTKWGDRGWFARTASAANLTELHRTTAFVIGLRIEGVSARDVAVLLLQRTSATTHPNFVNHPGLSVAPASPSSNVLIGGGFDAYADPNAGGPWGQFGTMSAPQIGQALACTPWGICRYVFDFVGWRGESKDHMIARPGWINVEMLTLPPTITVGGTTYQVQKRVISATSAVVGHPAIDVSGLRGEFALTGIGATVDWRRFDSAGNQTAAGNLLWKLEPREDLGGASVASKDHVISSPASITAYAIGIKLVPPTLSCIGC